MQKISLGSALLMATVVTALGQARINFNNIANYSSTAEGLVRINPNWPYADPHGGPPGAYVGSDYSVQLLWKAGSFSDLASFLAASPSASASVIFFGTTGGGPTIDGAGLFDGGTVNLGGPAGLYTFLVRAWYNGGGTYPTFEAAASSGRNFGISQLFNANATAPPTPPPTTMFPSFTVGYIPEPRALGLGGLGLAALILSRRRD